MRYAAILLAGALLVAATAQAAETPRLDRWVPPPAPHIRDGERIAPMAEVFGGTGFIVHLPKPEQADWRQTRYEVVLKRAGEQRFRVTLVTRPFTKTDEVVFITLPADSAADFVLEVIDQGRYPYQRVWEGSVASIEVMAD